MCVTHRRPQTWLCPCPQAMPKPTFGSIRPQFPDEETKDQRLSVVCLRSHSWFTAQTSCYFLFSRCSIFLDIKDQQKILKNRNGGGREYNRIANFLFLTSKSIKKP